MQNFEKDRTESILIVDDEPINLRLLRAHLAKQGYEVIEASGGEKALELALEEPDLILLDIMMPGMDGFETCSRLKANEALKNIPVIFLSALTDTDIKTKGLEAGGVDYISKPFDSRELLARVRTHLTIKRQERQIRGYADNLEEMVEERTQKLKEAEQELQRDYDIQTVINSLLRLSLDTISLMEVLRLTLEQTLDTEWRSFLPKGCILLANPGRGMLEMAASYNLDEELANVCSAIPLNEPLDQVLDPGHNQPLVVRDGELQQSGDIAENMALGHLGAPIMHGDEFLGVINVQLKEGLSPDRKEQDFLRAVANTLARVIIYKRSEERLIHHAFHDTLTGLPNRVYLTDMLEAEVVQRREGGAPDANSNQFALLLLDLDRFNMINESLGHTIGDQLLKLLALRLQEQLGPQDTLARLGGDEFVVLMPHIDSVSKAVGLAERIQTVIKQPFSLEGHELFTTLSIGIALSSIGYDKPEDVIRDADTAMHRAKLMGKARYVVFDQAMHDKARALMQLVTDLRLAIVREEFVLNYQPIVELATGKTIGFEALIRWIHPTRGLVSPGEFIPVAEETGLIIPIGQWVLREACKDMKGLYSENGRSGCSMISVNISGKQFGQEDLYDQVRDVLDETGFEPACLKLEITETVIMENARQAVNMLEKLKTLDVQLSIDDFGTGYSSLSYLNKFPVDMLKVDRSFVSSMTASSENLEIVRTILSLAHDMGLQVIAEGVETKEQRVMLHELGCEYVQGFYFSKPLPLDDVRKQKLLDKGW